MAIEAPISKSRKTNLVIYIVICVVLAGWCIYDVHFNEDFETEYGGQWWFTLNKYAPPYLIGLAVLFGLYYVIIRNKKLIADENELFFNDKKKIPYDSIQKIDKTYFDKKGFFIITYKSNAGNEIERKLSNRQYDNLAAILDHLVAKIT